MAEAIIVLGVLSSVITCIEVGMKVSERLEYYLSRTKSPPQSESDPTCAVQRCGQ